MRETVCFLSDLALISSNSFQKVSVSKSCDSINGTSVHGFRPAQDSEHNSLWQTSFYSFASRPLVFLTFSFITRCRSVVRTELPLTKQGKSRYNKTTSKYVTLQMTPRLFAAIYYSKTLCQEGVCTMLHFFKSNKTNIAHTTQ